MQKRITEKGEIERLSQIYKDLPPNEFAVAEGLIIQAARLRVRLDKLWRDLKKNGEVELFTQSATTAPYEKKRPAACLLYTSDAADE